MYDTTAVCSVCSRHCRLSEGMTGACQARRNISGTITPINYGVVSSLALDPIEKKPLNNFFPGSKILSVGSFGCNLSARITIFQGLWPITTRECCPF